jgi:hypothetical protein
MADNITVPLTGSGDTTKVVRTKDRAAVETQIVALDLNPAGSETLMAGGMPADTVASATVTQKASSATSITLCASNGSRKGLYIFNASTQILYVKLGATASTTSYTVQIAAGGYWEQPSRPVYTGIVDGIWASANGNAYVTEV